MSPGIISFWLPSGVAALWIIWQFLVRREGVPGAELGIDAVFVGRQDHQWLIEVVAVLANRGFVRHDYSDFSITVRYFLPEDEIRDGEAAIHYQLECERTIDQRIGGKKRTFANVAYIEPRLTFRHSYITFVPADSTFIWLQCRMKFRPGIRRRGKTKNVQRLLQVPTSES
jgi:hypothetical protein